MIDPLLMILLIGGAGFVLCAVVIGILAHKQTKEASESKKILSSEYQSALREFRKNPTDITLRRKALIKGRAALRTSFGQPYGYYPLYQGISEIIIRNDLDAISLGAVVIEATPAIPIMSIEDRLNSLADLLSKDLISEDEYHHYRQQILSSI